MGLIVRMLQSLPLVIVLVILAIVIYFVVSWMHSPTKAKEVLIRFFTVISIVISAFFFLASAYAFGIERSCIGDYRTVFDRRCFIAHYYAHLSLAFCEESSSL